MVTPSKRQRPTSRPSHSSSKEQGGTNSSKSTNQSLKKNKYRTKYSQGHFKQNRETDLEDLVKYYKRELIEKDKEIKNYRYQLFEVEIFDNLGQGRQKRSEKQTHERCALEQNSRPKEQNHQREVDVLGNWEQETKRQAS